MKAKHASKALLSLKTSGGVERDVIAIRVREAKRKEAYHEKGI